MRLDCCSPGWQSKQFLHLFGYGGCTVEKKIALSMRGITKRFGKVTANENVNFIVNKLTGASIDKGVGG